MTTYRNGFTYRTDLAYKGNNGVFQKPVLARAISVAANDAEAVNPVAASAWGALSKIDYSLETGWKFAIAQNQDSAMPWGKPFALSQEAELAHKNAIPFAFDLSTEWGKPIPANTEETLHWGEAIALPEILYSMRWSKTHRADAEKTTGWLTITHRYEGEFYKNDYPYRSWFRYPLERRSLALDALTMTKWGGLDTKDTESIVPWGGGFAIWGIDKPLEWTSDTRPLPDKEAPPDPVIKEYYNIMATDLTVKDVETNTPLAVNGISIGLDLDSFAWTLSAQVLNRASMDLCMPSKLISVSTMGYEWIFLVESYSSNRDIGKTWRISAASQSRVLDAPYQDLTSHIEATSTTWKQAIGSLVPLGWEANYEKITDYAIPANAWSYNDKTPKGALSELLEAIGAVAVPDLAEQKLNIQPRYKYAPWEYYLETTVPDVIIHESMVFTDSGQFRPATQNNGQWVSGNNQYGVVVDVTRSGTDGQPYAPDFFHELITDTDAASQRAKQTLSASGDKTLVTLQTFITDEQASPSLVLPGMLVEVQSEGETWRGICLSTQIDGAGLPAITQMLTIERDHGNYN